MGRCPLPFIVCTRDLYVFCAFDKYLAVDLFWVAFVWQLANASTRNSKLSTPVQRLNLGGLLEPLLRSTASGIGRQGGPCYAPLFVGIVPTDLGDDPRTGGSQLSLDVHVI